MPGTEQANAARLREPYTRAQHALVVSEAVETLAGLRLPARRVLAMHAWLAEVRDAELRDEKRAGEGKKRLALRTIDLEALADVLAHTSRWDASVAPAAAAFDESLRSLGGLDAENRRRLALYALLAETVLAGLGTVVAEAAIHAAGLAWEAPESWVRVLLFVRRMADAAVRRDLQGPAFGERSAFPAVSKRIEPLAPADRAGSDRGVSNEDLRRVPRHYRQAQAVRESLFRPQVECCGRTLGPKRRRVWIKV